MNRVNEMLTLRFTERWTLQNIAEKFGISRERVRQIIGNTGAGFVTQKRKEIFESNKKLSNLKLSKLMGISPSAVTGGYRDGERHEIEGGALQIGTEMEEYVSRLLTQKGIAHKLMPHHHTFDILIGKNIRVDVKSARPLSRAQAPTYSFNTSQDQRGKYADFFICITSDTKEVFVIPANETRGNATPIRFAFPEADYGRKSKWLKYHNRFDLLKG